MRKYLLMGTVLSSVLVFNGCGGVSDIVNNAFALTSDSIEDGGVIAEKFSRNGGNTSPHMKWEHAPDGTKSYTLIMDDPDAKNEAAAGHTWVHWNVFLKDAQTTELAENASLVNMPAGTVEGTTDGGMVHYEGPNPPPEKKHTYHFCVYALSSEGIPAGVTIQSSFTRAEFEAKYAEDILDKACMTGKYTGR